MILPVLRSTIEEVLNIDGILFRLVDTAGIREHTSDIIESIGVERSKEKIKSGRCGGIPVLMYRNFCGRVATNYTGTGTAGRTLPADW